MRSDAREAAFQIVFADLFGGDGKKGFRASVYKEHKLKEDECAFAEKLVNAVFSHKDALMEEISAHVTRFADYRIYPADKAVLLLALAEIRYCDDAARIFFINTL